MLTRLHEDCVVRNEDVKIAVRNARKIRPDAARLFIGGNESRGTIDFVVSIRDNTYRDGVRFDVVHRAPCSRKEFVPDNIIVQDRRTAYRGFPHCISIHRMEEYSSKGDLVIGPRAGAVGVGCPLGVV